MQSHKLKKQLAGLQDGFIKMTNSIMELTCALQSAQHIKKKVGQLQEMLGDME